MKVFTSWGARLFPRLLRMSKNNYYRSLSAIPIKNFTLCMSGNYSYACKHGQSNPAEARRAWSQVFDEYLATYGLPENYEAYIKKMARALAFRDQANNGKSFQIVRAHILEAEAAELIKSPGESIEIVCAHVSKFMGFPVRAHECSAADFYSYKQLMQST